MKSCFKTALVVLALAACATGCRRKSVEPVPEPAPVVAPYSVDRAFAQYRKAWAVVALAAAEQADKGISETDVNDWAKPRKAEALKQSFAVLADEMDARLSNPATPEEYAAAMREMAYLADPSLKVE